MSTMTPEQQNIAIAEACGKLVYRHSFLAPYHDQQIQKRVFRDMEHAEIAWITDSKYGGCSPIETEIDLDNILDYTGDLNAMAEAEKALTPTQTNTYRDLLLDMHQHTDYRDGVRVSGAISATAAQRAEAFLRTLGKWEDSE